MNNTDSQGLPARVAVITSASGSEHVVSQMSAENVCTALRAKFQAVQVFAFDEHFRAALMAWRPDVVFPVGHGAGETGALQKILQSLGMPYVGSDARSSTLCRDKAAANRTVAAPFTRDGDWSIDEPGTCAVPSFVELKPGDDVRRSAQRFFEAKPGAGHLVVKPARESSSVGVSFCVMPNNKSLSAEEVTLTINGPIAEYRLDRIVAAVEHAFTFDDVVILQVAVSGTEITVSVLEDPEPTALPVVEIARPAGAWYAGGSEYFIPARLPASWMSFAQAAAVSIHRALGCSDYSRSSFIVETSAAEPVSPRVWFLGCDASPGFAATSLFPRAALAAGYAMPNLTRRLVVRAWKRRGRPIADTPTPKEPHA